MYNPSNNKIAHIILGGSIGNVTEWYNFLLYGYLAPVIAKQFFPVQNKLLSLTLVFTVFALSFFARPLGGILFGRIGDRYGRQRALLISLIAMAIPTLLIAFLPTYQVIGIASPILLCIFRICQGLSAGGEHTGSAIYLAEHAPPTQRSLWVSTVPTSAAFGLLISSFASLILINSFSNEQLLSWGWRAAYLIGAVMCLISILFRLTLPETPHFKKMQLELRQHTSLLALFKNPHTLQNLLIVFALAASWGIFYQVLFIWMPTYLTEMQHFKAGTALIINSLFLSILACLILFIGHRADQISRKRLLMISCFAMFCCAYSLFLLLSSGQIWQAYLAMALFTLIFSLFLPTAFVMMVEAFHAHERYTGLSFGFNAGLAIFGGTCPLIVTWLIQATQNQAAPAFYMMLAALPPLLIFNIIKDKRGEMIS